MTCKDAIEQLHEFLDNELDEGNYLKTKQHIDMCQKCCEKFEFEQTLKKTIKDRSPLYKTPQYVLQNITNQWAELNKDYSHAEMAREESKDGYFKGIFDFFRLRPAYVTMRVFLPVTGMGVVAYLTFCRPA